MHTRYPLPAFCYRSLLSLPTSVSAQRASPISFLQNLSHIFSVSLHAYSSLLLIVDSRTVFVNTVRCVCLQYKELLIHMVATVMNDGGIHTDVNYWVKQWEMVETGQTTMQRILTFTHNKLSQVLNCLHIRYVEFSYKFTNALF